MLTFGLKIRLMRLFGRIKTAFSYPLAVKHYLHQPFSLMLANTKKPRFVGFGRLPHVLQVAKSGNFSEIVKSVVRFDPVLVVDVISWKRARHIQPSKTMSELLFVVDGNCPVAGVCSASGSFANKVRATAVNFPHKLACAWGIVQNRSKMVSGNHDFEFTIGTSK